MKRFDQALMPLFFSSVLFVGMLSPAKAFDNLEQAPISCLLAPSFDVELSSEVQGVIEELTVQRGDFVQRGQVVMRLKSTLEQASLKTFRARLDFANRKVDRNAALMQKNLIAEVEQDEMLTEQNLASHQLAEAQVRLKQRQTISPITGVVVERIKDPGEFVDETPFLRIAALNPLHADIVLPASYYGKLSKGESIQVKAVNSTTTHRGEIKLIDPIIDAASNTFGITVSLDNSQNQLAAGVRCQIDL